MQKLGDHCIPFIEKVNQGAQPNQAPSNSINQSSIEINALKGVMRQSTFQSATDTRVVHSPFKRRFKS